MPNKQFVTVAMPALDEERYIEEALRSITRISEAIDYEVLVLDGGSTDRTPEIVRSIAQHNPRIRLVANERRLQSAAVNLAAEIADQRARWLVRADCHAIYPDGFVETCLSALEKSGAVSVVVPMQTVGRTCLQIAIATAQNSVLGNGGSAHRRAGVSRFVEHGHHAAFRRAAFLEVGGYDESFTHNEDAELDVRLQRDGDRIWLETSCPIVYYPRSTFTALIKQYYRHGGGRARTLFKHRLRPHLRQILPLIAVGAAVLGTVCSIVYPELAIVPMAYVGSAVSVGIGLAVRDRSVCALASGLAALAMHVGWAVGFTSSAIARTMTQRQGDSGQVSLPRLHVIHHDKGFARVHSSLTRQSDDR